MLSVFSGKILTGVGDLVGPPMVGGLSTGELVRVEDVVHTEGDVLVRAGFLAACHLAVGLVLGEPRDA